MEINIVGAGLAGVECAWAIANRGYRVNLFEMKPVQFSEVHRNPNLAEIVCSNSFGAIPITTASGVLKKEMEICSSIVIESAYLSKVEAGKALAVDRERFSKIITEKIEAHPNIRLIREPVSELNDRDIWIVACGPLCSEKLAFWLKRLFGDRFLHFYDAIAPIVYADSVDYSRGFWGSRYSDEKDYFNCVMNEDEYELFYRELIKAEKVRLREFEKNYYEACLPIEELAERGKQTLLFGPLKPVGLKYNGKTPFAVVQLRKENREATLLGMVGFQTRLTYPEQKRVFRLIPALRNAEFAKLGSVHRNLFIDSPRLLNEFLQLRDYPNIFFAGQITGVEGYMASAASGIYVGMNVALFLKSGKMLRLPKQSMMGGLVDYITTKEGEFQPIGENFGFIGSVRAKNKKEKRLLQARIAIENVRRWREEYEGYFTQAHTQSG